MKTARTLDQKKKHFKNSKDLNNSIPGSYAFKAIQNKYISNTKKNISKKYKEIHSIVIGTFKPVIFINHTDYSNVVAPYVASDCGDFLYFVYNEETYALPVLTKNTPNVKIIHLKEESIELVAFNRNKLFQ